MKHKLLIVDDEITITKMLKIALGDEYDIRIAEDGPSAVDIARNWIPDLITLDIMLPNKNGYEVAKELTKFEDTADIPIIMVTAKNTLESELQGLESGAVDYIVKPYQIESLKRKIQSHLRQREKIKEDDTYSSKSLIPMSLVGSRRRSGVFRKLYITTKRMFDIVMSAIALIILSPVLLGVAIAVRIDTPGPIVFGQNRTGRNGQRFKMYKFRTMVQNAEELKEKYMHLNELTWPDFKITNDPRITRVGKILRKTSLDELPQLWNILRGDMSFVGPRPTSFSKEKYKLWHTERMEVRPGLTGLWQISARAEVDLDGRSELDIEYIEHQSWQLDILILWRTVGVVLTGRGAR